MGESIQYKGEYLGKMHLGRDKYHMLVFKGIAPLEKLLKLNPDETISFGGAEITMSRFREEFLPNIDTIYTSPEAFLNKEGVYPIGFRVPDEFLKKAGLVE